MKLKNRLTLVYSGITIVFTILIILTINILVKSEFEKYAINRQNNDVSELIDKIILERSTTNNFNQINHDAMAHKFNVKIFDSGGQLLYQSSPPGPDKEPQKNSEYIENIYALIKDGVDYGYAVIGSFGRFNYSNQDQNYLDTVNLILIISGLGLVISSIVVSYLVAQKISNPIRAIQRRTKDIENGIYNDDTEKSKIKEIHELANSIHALSLTLREQDAIKKRLARDYAHELKTPLASLQSNIEGMIDEVIPINNEKLEALRSEVIRLNRLVDGVNKIVMANEELHLNLEVFSLSDLAEQIIDSFDASVKEKGLLIYKNIKQVSVKADKDKIAQVIFNLLSNAIKYTNQGSIKVSIYEKNKNIIFVIEDTGVGISKSEIPFIFGNLYRSEDSRSQQIEGFGIGLSIVKSIINAHQGEIIVESELEKGAKFTIILTNL